MSSTQLPERNSIVKLVRLDNPDTSRIWLLSSPSVFSFVRLDRGDGSVEEEYLLAWTRQELFIIAPYITRRWKRRRYSRDNVKRIVKSMATDSIAVRDIDLYSLFNKCFAPFRDAVYEMVLLAFYIGESPEMSAEKMIPLIVDWLMDIIKYKSGKNEILHQESPTE